MERFKKTMMVIIPLLIVSIAFAGGPVMESRTTLQSVDENNQQKPENSISAKPGDIIKVVIEYFNTGDEDAYDPELQYPIKQFGDYIPGSAIGENCEIMFSIDDGNSFAVPPIKYVEILDGEQIEKIATEEKYTHIKWIYSGAIEPEDGVELSFEVKIDGSGKEKEE